MEVERLRIEAAALAAPERIEPRAKALGLMYPKPEQILALDETRHGQRDVAAGAKR